MKTTSSGPTRLSFFSRGEKSNASNSPLLASQRRIAFPSPPATTQQPSGVNATELKYLLESARRTRIWACLSFHDRESRCPLLAHSHDDALTISAEIGDVPEPLVVELRSYASRRHVNEGQPRERLPAVTFETRNVQRRAISRWRRPETYPIAQRDR